MEVSAPFSAERRNGRASRYSQENGALTSPWPAKPAAPPPGGGAARGPPAPGVERVHGPAGAFGASGQLTGEVRVGELGAAVGPQAAVTFGGLQVVEVEPVAGVAGGGGREGKA